MMTIDLVADTHAILWYLYDDRRLSAAALQAMESVEQAGNQIAIASITLAEIVYLLEKERIHPLAFDRIVAGIEDEDSALVEVPFDRKVAAEMRRIDRAQVPDLPDRIVAATALCLDVPVVSKDRKIRASSVRTIW